MGYQTVFKRYELKYMLTREQKAKILKAIAPYMTIDDYGRTTIRNIYFDTDDYILARHSIARPDFKEKLRIRSYSKAAEDSTVFVELKRKYDHVVYKRRVALREKEAMDWVEGAYAPAVHAAEPQMAGEIDYFLGSYKGLRPALYLSYEREAYRMNDMNDGSDFRVTFDENILARDYDMSLESDAYGEPVMERDRVLMELKCSGGIPMWMTKILSELKVYKTSFSKYGTAYKTMIYPSVSEAAAERYRASAAAECSREAAAIVTGQSEAAGAYGSGRFAAEPETAYAAKHAKPAAHERRRSLFGFGHQNATA